MDDRTEAAEHRRTYPGPVGWEKGAQNRLCDTARDLPSRHAAEKGTPRAMCLVFLVLVMKNSPKLTTSPFALRNWYPISWITLGCFSTCYCMSLFNYTCNEIGHTWSYLPSAWVDVHPLEVAIPPVLQVAPRVFDIPTRWRASDLSNGQHQATRVTLLEGGPRNLLEKTGTVYSVYCCPL